MEWRGSGPIARVAALTLGIGLALGCPTPIDDTDAGDGGDQTSDGGGSDLGRADTPAPDHATAPDSARPPRVGAYGRICAPSGDFFVADAEVVVSLPRWVQPSNPAPSRRTETNERGEFHLRDLPTGVYTFTATYRRLSVTFEAAVEEPGSPGTLESGLTDLGDHCFPGDILSLAVIEGAFDMIEEVIFDLGFTDVTVLDSWEWDQTFFTLDNLALYDAVYLNCGIDDTDLSYTEVSAALRDYVDQGGALYASDWSYFFVERAYPDAVDFLDDDMLADEALAGAAEEITARVHDPTLEKMCGREITIDFDLDYFAVITASGAETDDLVSGTVHSFSDWGHDQHEEVPLLVRFDPGEAGGRVIYTTFHNEAQATDDALCTLKYVILSL